MVGSVNGERAQCLWSSGRNKGVSGSVRGDYSDGDVGGVSNYIVGPVEATRVQQAHYSMCQTA